VGGPDEQLSGGPDRETTVRLATVLTLEPGAKRHEDVGCQRGGAVGAAARELAVEPPGLAERGLGADDDGLVIHRGVGAGGDRDVELDPGRIGVGDEGGHGQDRDDQALHACL